MATATLNGSSTSVKGMSADAALREAEKVLQGKDGGAPEPDWTDDVVSTAEAVGGIVTTSLGEKEPSFIQTDLSKVILNDPGAVAIIDFASKLYGECLAEHVKLGEMVLAFLVQRRNAFLAEQKANNPNVEPKWSSKYTGQHLDALACEINLRTGSANTGNLLVKDIKVSEFVRLYKATYPGLEDMAYRSVSEIASRATVFDRTTFQTGIHKVWEGAAKIILEQHQRTLDGLTRESVIVMCQRWEAHLKKCADGKSVRSRDQIMTAARDKLRKGTANVLNAVKSDLTNKKDQVAVLSAAMEESIGKPVKLVDALDASVLTISTLLTYGEAKGLPERDAAEKKMRAFLAAAVRRSGSCAGLERLIAMAVQLVDAAKTAANQTEALAA